MTTAPAAVNNAELVRRAQAADEEALSTIYERYAPGIFRYIYYRLGDPELARDVQSEVFVRMLEGIGSYEDRGWPISAWLYRIAHARTVDALRRKDRSRQTSLEPWSILTDGPDEDLELSADKAAVRRALARLGDSQRQVLTLRFIYGLSLEETAKQMGRTVGSIKSLQHRATQRIGEFTREELGEG
jgi:RNA polymerase sigma-70 factor (ECF subfamily)